MEIEKEKIIELKEKFDSIINTEEKDNIEFWHARDLRQMDQWIFKLFTFYIYR